MSDENIQRDGAAGGRPSRISPRLIDLMAHPLAAVLPAASTLLFGLATGFFLLALRQENLGAGNWIALFGSGLAVLATTGGREMGRDRVQRQQTGDLRHAIRDVLEVAQTMPPRTFLGDFDELYRRESTATAVMVRGFLDSRPGRGDAALRQRVDHSIRSVLDAMLDLAWIWDETRMDYVENSADIAWHCREHLLYTPASLECVEAFYAADAKGRSIVSFPIQGYTGGGETRPNTIGAVNIYRNRHGIMGGAKRAQQFALVTGPFRDLLFRLLQVRNELDQRLVGPE